MQMYPAVDWRSLPEPHFLHQSNTFTSTLCNGVSLGAIESVISLRQMHPKLRTIFLQPDRAFVFMKAGSMSFLSFSDISSPGSPCSWFCALLLNLRVPPKWSSVSVFGHVTTSVVCVQAVCHMARESLSLLLTLHWCKELIPFRVYVVPRELRFQWGLVFGKPSYGRLCAAYDLHYG